jgi:hypothetical protein
LLATKASPAADQTAAPGSDGVSGKRGGLAVRRWGALLLLARWREDDTMPRIHAAVGVDPIDFQSGYPKLVRR